MSNLSVLPRIRAYSQTYDCYTKNKWMLIVSLLVNLGRNEAYGGISLFHFMRNGMVSYERNCVDTGCANF